MATSSSYPVHRVWLRTIVNILLLRHATLLRKVLYSRYGYLILHERNPLAPLLQKVKRQFSTQNKVRKLPALLKTGFIERAVVDMQNIATTSMVFAERLTVSLDLGLYFASQADHAKKRQALFYLEYVLKHDNKTSHLCAAAIAKSECLTFLKRSAEALTFIEMYSKKKNCNEFSLALANCYHFIENVDHSATDSKRLMLTNMALATFRLQPLQLRNPEASFTLDNIHAPTCPPGTVKDGPLVTVIIPAYNAQDSITTAIRSLLEQSWRKLELIVVDDSSTDDTVAVVKRLIEQDDRIRLIQRRENQGPYVARNIALQEAQGTFVTVNDADDWSHPRKIEIQAQHLVENPNTVANLSMWVRATTEMIFQRNVTSGKYARKNMSSLMFHRLPVMSDLGCWDSVRFAGDSEFLVRLKKVYGEAAVQELKTGPLSFGRQESHSLTANASFGYFGFLMGARRAYFEAYGCWHSAVARPYIGFPLKNRPFPVSAPMLPIQTQRRNSRVMHLDVVIATEFRLTGGTVSSTLEEVKAQTSLGLQTGLMPLARFDLNPQLPWNNKILDVIDGKTVHLLVHGQDVSCDLLIVRHPPILQEHQNYLPNIKANNIVVVVNQAPFRDYNDPHSRLYSPEQCQRNLERFFPRQTAVWHPIGPAVRDALIKDLFPQSNVEVAEEDWVNIIDVDSGHVDRENHLKKSRPVIGRHSRDQYVKWPENADELLAAYPRDEAFEVRILGGAETPKNLLGGIPGNWTVYPFDTLSVKDFLGEIDVFVYFTHPGLVEAFGRTPLEAMAAGVPVILPEHFKPLFRDAAIYATPGEVQGIVMQLHEHADYYNSRVAIGLNFVKEQFGYRKHKERLSGYITNKSF